MLEGNDLYAVQSIVYHLTKALTEFKDYAKSNDKITDQQVANFTSGIQLAQLMIEQIANTKEG